MALCFEPLGRVADRMMIFERENGQPLKCPSTARVVQELKRLRSHGTSSYASLTSPDGSYLQVGGGGAGCVLERRSTEDGRHYRAYQDEPVVPLEDGTEISFGGSRIPLQQGEWLSIKQVNEVFVAYLNAEPLPDFVKWRDISDLFE